MVFLLEVSPKKYPWLPSGNLTWRLKMAIEIVDFPIKNGGSFHSYVSLPEGKHTKHLENQWFP
jgi:hypothetical protein